MCLYTDIVCYSSDYILWRNRFSNSVSNSIFNNYFCSDTYLMEVKVSVPMYFICMTKKAVKSNIAESERSNIIFINTFLCWICFVFLAKPGSVNEGISGIQIFLLYFIAMFGTIWFWSICSVICVHCFEICGQVLDVYLELSLDLYQKREVHFSEIWDCFLSAFVNLLN